MEFLDARDEKTARCGSEPSNAFAWCCGPPAAGEALDDVRDGERDVAGRIAMHVPEHEEIATR